MSTDTQQHPEPTFFQRLAEEDWSFRAWLALLRDLYLSFDRRTLGFTRILLGFLMTMDVIHRGAAWMEMYSSIGVAPTPLNLQRPSVWSAFTIFNAFANPPELRVLWVLMLLAGISLMVGFKTKVAQIAALFLVEGMNARLGPIENGGYVVNNLLFMWTVFLPMGDRFSVDALLASMRRRREINADDLNDRSDMLPPELAKPHVSVLGLALCIQIWAIYYFNVLHKTGPAWHNGTAVHYVLYVDRMATPVVALMRDHIPNLAFIFMTRSALLFEAAIGVVLLQPFARAWARRAVIFMMNTLHIAFGVTFTLGPFAWSCCVFSTLFFSRDDWEIAMRTMRRTSRARTVVFNPRSGGALLVCRLLKRLDRFELLTFEAEDHVPLGIGVRSPVRSTGALLGHADAVADVLEALPLGPCLAWIPRLPGVKSIVGAALGALETRDVSAFFGLTVRSRKPPVVPQASGTPRVRWYVVVPAVLVVAGAVTIAVIRDQAFSGTVLVIATVLVTGAIATWLSFPVLTVHDLRRGVLGTAREMLILAMFAGAVNQAGVELWVVNRRWKVPQPEPLRLLSHKLRLLQGWFMFSPNPVMEDGTIVVDAVTIDGRHVDPFTGVEPNFDLINAKSLGLTQIWGDYFNRIQLPAWSGYREAMKDYMYRLPERTGHPEDAIVSGDVYWIKDMNPKWGDTHSYAYERSKLFSFENPAARQSMRK